MAALTEVAAVDVAVGMERYATEGPECSGRARSYADDFQVEEVLSALSFVKEPVQGYLPLYRVEKRGIDTMHMAKEISAELKSRVSYGGLKDSRARAVQYVTPTSTRSARPERIEKEKFSANLLGYIPSPLTRGSLNGNRFSIVLRDCCDQIGGRLEDAFAAARDKKIPNYFGLQRFGTAGTGTHLVGRALVKRDFEGAVRLLVGEEGKGEGLGRGQDVERSVAMELRGRPGEWVGALRKVPIRLRRLYVQAYQSYIFNRTMSLALAAGEDITAYKKGDNWAEVSGDGLSTSYPKSAKASPEGKAVPVVQLAGYAYRDYGSRFDAYTGAAMKSEGVSPVDFYVEEMQEVSAEGGFRRPHLAVSDGTWKVEGSVATLRFALARGQYATVLLREVLKPGDPAGSGLV
jgi:tRNA pseudouridine13 synthase